MFDDDDVRDSDGGDDNDGGYNRKRDACDNEDPWQDGNDPWYVASNPSGKSDSKDSSRSSLSKKPRTEPKEHCFHDSECAVDVSNVRPGRVPWGPDVGWLCLLTSLS